MDRDTFPDTEDETSPSDLDFDPGPQPYIRVGTNHETGEPTFEVAAATVPLSQLITRE